jgi:hypothetical protein
MEYPTWFEIIKQEDIPEKRKCLVVTDLQNSKLEVINGYSSFNKSLTVVAYVSRFIRNDKTSR